MLNFCNTWHFCNKSTIFYHQELFTLKNVSREQKYQRAACPHDLRHSFACRSLENLLQNGVDEDDAYPYLSTYIGHEDLYSTQRYLKYPTERMGEDVAKHETYVEEIYNSVPIFQEDISAWTK